MKSLQLAFTFAIASLIIGPGAGYALAANNTFQETNIDDDFDYPWSDTGNWSLSHVPTNTENAVIPTGKTATIRNEDADAVADTFTIQGTGVIDIEASRKLTVDGSASSVAGSLNLLGSGSELAFITANHAVSGAGKIDGQQELAVISIAGGITLTLTAIIEGKLDITGAGNFTNRGRVIADIAGILDIQVTGAIDDSANTGACSSSNNRWAVTVSGATLLFSGADPSDMEGYFWVSDGTLQAGDDFAPGDAVNVCTVGHLCQIGGVILAGVDDSFKFDVASCP